MTNDESNKCVICTQDIKNKVNITCKKEHEFCFACITNWWFNGNNVDPVCPVCTGGDGGLLIRPENVDPGSDLESILTLLPYIFRCNCTNKNCYRDCSVCGGLKNKINNMVYYPNWLLKSYVQNKDVVKLMVKYKDDPELVKNLTWKSNYEQRPPRPPQRGFIEKYIDINTIASLSMGIMTTCIVVATKTIILGNRK